MKAICRFISTNNLLSVKRAAQITIAVLEVLIKEITPAIVEGGNTPRG